MLPTAALLGQTRPRRESSPLPPAAPTLVVKTFTRLPLPPDERYRQVRAFAQLVDQQFRTLKAVSTYARQLALSPNYLNALCRRLLHQTASDVLHARIVAEAQLLLAGTDNSVAVIAADLGFDDASYFCRHFKKHVHQTPLAFRGAQAAALD